jgi:hypothetical protein
MQEIDAPDPCDDIIHFCTRKLRLLRDFKARSGKTFDTVKQFIRHAKGKKELYETNQKIELERRRTVRLGEEGKHAIQTTSAARRPEEASAEKRPKKSTATVRRHSIRFLV